MIFRIPIVSRSLHFLCTYFLKNLYDPQGCYYKQDNISFVNITGYKYNRTSSLKMINAQGWQFKNRFRMT